MKRLPGWEFAFAAEINAAHNRRFSWGKFDCGLFVCDCVKAMTGVDLADGIRGYTNVAGAYKAIRWSMEETAVSIAERFGLKEVPPVTASRGDVVLLYSGQLAIVGLDASVAIGASSYGLAKQPRETWKRAWRVG